MPDGTAGIVVTGKHKNNRARFFGLQHKRPAPIKDSEPRISNVQGPIAPSPRPLFSAGLGVDEILGAGAGTGTSQGGLEIVSVRRVKR